MTQYETLSLVVTSIGVAGAFVAAYVAYHQLKRMAEAGEAAVEANKLAALGNVLQLENTIHQRREMITERFASLKNLSSQASISKDQVDSASKLLNESVESYLNSVDRLCASMLRKLIPEEEYRKDYRPLVNEIMTGDMFKPFFHAGTPYRNIVNIHGIWAEQ